MTRKLFLYIEPEKSSSSALFFQLVEGESVIDQGLLSVDELNRRIESVEDCVTTVVVPGEWVSSLLVTPPKGSQRHLKQAIPYLLEDELASALETLHIATSRQRPDGQILCAIIDQALLEQQLLLLNEIGIKPSVLIPDYWAMAGDTEQSRVALKAQRLLICNPDSTGLAISRESDESSQSLFLPEIYTQGSSPEIPEWQAQTSYSIPLNLLQGKFAPDNKNQVGVWLKPLVIAACASLIFLMTYWLGAGIYFKNNAENLGVSAEKQYRTLFPNDKRLTNIRRQMEAHLKNNGANQHESLFFEFMSVLATSMSKQAEPATIKHIRFEQDSSSLQIELQAQSIAYANTLQTAVEASGLSADVLSANINDGGALTRLKIKTRDR
ncbi:MAG: hypothetical protein KBT63_01430 [Porticoccaceae bacterium]|nr:hypothetical protein [Porticoccaceae bacterium]